MKRQCALTAAAYFMLLALCAGTVGAQEQQLSAIGALAKARAETGDADAQNELGLMYLYGENGFPQDEEMAVSWFLRAAGQGHADAQFNLGDYFLYWDLNSAEALGWYNKAAAQGHPGSFYALAGYYESGLAGMPVDLGRALELFRKSADMNCIMAQLHLGRIYHEGMGVRKDLVQSAAWFRRAAEQGDPEGQYRLGNACYRGEGVAPEKAQAAEWYRQAAELGHAMAQNNLGSMHLNGEGGLPKNHAEASHWFQRAADQGNPLGMYNLAAVYKEIIKVPVEAYKWFMLAGEILAKEKETDAAAWAMPGGPSGTASGLAQECLRQLNKLARSMTPEEVSEAQKKALALAAELKKRKV